METKQSRESKSVRINKDAHKPAAQMALDDGVSRQDFISALIIAEHRRRDECKLEAKAFMKRAKAQSPLLEELTFKEGVALPIDTSMPMINWTNDDD